MQFQLIQKNNIIYVNPGQKELGYVGIPKKINSNIIEEMINQNKIPVVAPLGLDENNQSYNINGDTAANAIAKKLKSRRLLLMTNVEGVYDDNKKLISEIKPFDLKNLIEWKVVQGGMIPKIKNCVDAVENGVRGVVILDGRKPHSILHEIFSDKGSWNADKKMKNLLDIKYWLFDLDNTLYDGATKVFEQVDKKMTKFISEKLSVGPEEARKIQKNYFQEYNTTLNGMIKHHKIDADEFLEFVHDVDLSFLDKDEYLKEEIEKLRERERERNKKIIFTNGSRAHALNVTKRIGIDMLFDGIFDIRDSEFIPKPSAEPYKKIVENYKIEPEYCIFFEDIARNLKPAFELGMKTVWIKNNEPWAAKFSDANFVNYRTDKLANFLKEINEIKRT